MITATVDIKINDLINLKSVEMMSLSKMTEEGHKKIFESYPFKLYSKRMMGENFITIQIPLDNFLLFVSHGLIVI